MGPISPISLMKKFAKRLTRWLIALALLPCLWAVYHQLFLMVPDLLSEGYKSWGLYLAGAGTYILIERLLSRPMWLYVFGHELTHVVSGLLSGAKIHSFKAKSSGGEVRLSKSNAFIALSPYVVPLYAVLILGLYALTRRWWNPPYLTPAFQVIMGAAVAFHISLTISAIHKHQPDLKVLGFFLSGVLILVGNGLIIGVLGISLFSRTPAFSFYLRGLSADTISAWKVAASAGNVGMLKTIKFIQSKPWIR